MIDCKIHCCLNFKSSLCQDLQAYCFAKLGKINKLKLELSEEKLANLIAQGIHDEFIRTIAAGLLRI